MDKNEDGEINGELSKEEFSVLAVFKTNKNVVKDEAIRQLALYKDMSF